MCNSEINKEFSLFILKSNKHLLHVHYKKKKNLYYVFQNYSFPRGYL